MCFFPAVSLLVILAVSFPVDTVKCPKVCSCDSSKLTVACIGKNLTEVPQNIDEVRILNVWQADCYFTQLSTE